MSHMAFYSRVAFYWRGGSSVFCQLEFWHRALLAYGILAIGILAYGRFAQNLMTSNSDLDLVFIFPDKNQNFQNQKTYHLILSLISQKMISILSSKTSENLIYEIDTKLGPKVRISSNACTLSEFKSFHENETFSWEKMALMKSKLVFKDSNFQNELEKVIQKSRKKKANCP